MELFGKMELNTYLCRAKKERDGLRHQRYITQTGYRTLPEFAKKETLRIIPQQFQARQHDTVQLTYPFRAQVKGVRDIPFFMYRLATVLG